MKIAIKNRQVEQFKASLFYLGLLTITAIVVWVGVSVYSSFSKTSEDPEIQALIKPINPTLDNETLENFASTRVNPPEQFRIQAQVISNGSSEKTTAVIDPFNDRTTQVSSVSAEPQRGTSTASASAGSSRTTQQ